MARARIQILDLRCARGDDGAAGHEAAALKKFFLLKLRGNEHGPGRVKNQGNQGWQRRVPSWS